MTADIKQLMTICDEGLAAVGYDLVDLEYQLEPQGWVLRVFIDHPVDAPGIDGSGVGITHMDCAEASRHLNTVLDVEDPIDDAYRLEVSSPGVYRRLRKERDFARFAGEKVKIQTDEMVEGRKNYKGRLLDAADGVVTVEVDGKHYQLPLERIRKARLEVEL
jgi:ribosome maturation factor RimP